VTLTYADGTTLVLRTAGSNVFAIGGPWQVELGGQLYVQYSPAFARAVAGLAQDLSLPFGEPEGMYCHPPEQSLLDLAYP
jgi:hypothetical protein